MGTFEHFLGTFGGLSKRECQGGSFDVTDVFFDYRVFVACCGPGGDDAVDAAAGPLADMEHGEHLDDDGVSRVGQTTFKHLFFSDPYGAWVFKDEAVTVFADHYSSSAVVVGVDEAVGEGFASPSRRNGTLRSWTMRVTMRR